MNDAEGVPPLTGDRSPLDAPPRAFGSYLVRADLGFGRFGQIFLADDGDSGRRAVVRVFSRRFTDEQRAALLTALEALCARPLDHPSIARPLVSGLAGSDVYVVHAYLDGVTIERFVAQYGAQLLADLLPRLTHAAAAIDYAAAAGVHHGSLTGRDVIVSPERTAISGFGLLQALVDAGVTTGTSTDTPSHADDVRALAVIALEALCGCEFSTIDVAATVMALPGAVPNRLLDAFEAALSPYPDLRPKTALDFAARLQQAIAEVPAVHPTAHPGDPAAAESVAAKSVVASANSDAGDTLRREPDPSGTVFRPEAALLLRPQLGAHTSDLPDAADAVFREPEPGGTTSLGAPAVAPRDIHLPPPPAFLRDLDPAHEQVRLRPAHREASAVTSAADADTRGSRPQADRASGVEDTDMRGVRLQPDRAVRAEDTDMRGGRPQVDRAPGVEDSGMRGVRLQADHVHSTVQLPVDHAHDAVADLPEPGTRNRSWLPAVAAALLIGLGAGFAGGYMLGWRGATRATAQAAQTGTPPEPAATSGRTFTDAPVGGDAPEHVPSASLPGTEPEAATAPVPATEVPARVEPVRPPAATRPAAAREQEPRRLSGNGSLLIESRPTGAQVRVDGTIVGRTPLVLPDVSAGSHSIGLELSGYQRWATAITVEGGVRTRVAASLEQ